jgi:hypothetical protein
MLHRAKRIPARSRSESNLMITRGYVAAAVSRAFRDAAGIFRGPCDEISRYDYPTCFLGKIKWIPTPPTISTKNAKALPSGPTLPPVSQVGP